MIWIFFFGFAIFLDFFLGSLDVDGGSISIQFFVGRIDDSIF